MHDHTGANPVGDATDRPQQTDAAPSPDGGGMDSPDAGQGDAERDEPRETAGPGGDAEAVFAPTEGGETSGMAIVLCGALFWCLVIILAVLEKVKLAVLR